MNSQRPDELLEPPAGKFESSLNVDPGKSAATNDSAASDNSQLHGKEVSASRATARRRLPMLEDEADVGVQKKQRVIRDGKADLAFSGILLAAAAPESAPDGHWQEYRIYETDGGKHVFSKVARSVYAGEQDRYEADVFEPSPTSVPTQLLRSARELARSRPLTWTDAAVAFFGYDPLAKVLYRKFGEQFDEPVS